MTSRPGNAFAARWMDSAALEPGGADRHRTGGDRSAGGIVDAIKLMFAGAVLGVLRSRLVAGWLRAVP